jgi:hypothetical protein
MSLLTVNFGLFALIDLVESVGIPIAIIESISVCFLDAMDCYCLLVMFESAGMRVLIVNLSLFVPIDVAESAGISIALAESIGMCFFDDMNCCCSLLTICVFIYDITLFLCKSPPRKDLRFFMADLYLYYYYNKSSC